MPETEARPRVKNRHGGAPRGERPASWDARRLARRLACRVMCTPHGCSAEHPNDSRRSASFFSKPLNGLENFSKPLVYPGLLPGWQRRCFRVFSPSPTTARARFNAPVTVYGAERSLPAAAEDSDGQYRAAPRCRPGRRHRRPSPATLPIALAGHGQRARSRSRWSSPTWSIRRGRFRPHP